MSHRVERAIAKKTRRRRNRIVLGVGAALAAALIAVVTCVPLPQGVGTMAPERTLSEAEVQRVSAVDATAMVDRGEGLLYDVRSREFFSAKHAGGAIALPEDELDALWTTLPKDKALVLY